MTLEQVVMDSGFDSEEDFHDLVANVDLRTLKKLRDFKIWQLEDGSKEGILKLASL